MGMSVRKKLAIATWSAPTEGNIYGKLVVDAQPALDYIASKREKTGIRVTMTHLVGAAIGRGIAKAPGLNGRLLLNYFIPHKTMDLAFLASIEGGKNLAKVKVCEVDEKPPTTIATELNERVEKLRKGEDEEFKKSMGPLKLFPIWLVKPLVWLTGWLTASLGIGAKAFGLEKFPFGSAIVTSVAMFGLDNAWAPMVPYARVPVVALVGAVKDAPGVVDGAVVPVKELTLTATFDHRFLDGAQGAIVAHAIRRYMADPYLLDKPMSQEDPESKE